MHGRGEERGGGGAGGPGVGVGGGEGGVDRADVVGRRHYGWVLDNITTIIQMECVVDAGEYA